MNKPHLRTFILFINDSRGGLYYKPRGFLRSPRHYCITTHSRFYLHKANKKYNNNNNARCKVDEIEVSVQNHVVQISQMYERLLSLERYSREYNLRFHNIEESPGEDCLQKIHDILANQLNLEPKLENAHRVGPRSDSKPRAIICKFVYRPERYKVIRKKRDLKDGVWITEDLIWEDREKKKKLKDVMKQAFESGKKPRFHRGKLYIDSALYRDT